MRRIIGAIFVSLDGVMQAPGGPQEDPTGGFAFGGWVAPHFDEQGGAKVGQLFSGQFDLLLGRRTYDIFASFWPFAQGEQADLGRRFDEATKYVMTRGDQPLDWVNSERVTGVEVLAQIKQGDGPDMIIQGSSTLYAQLLGAGLIDQLTVMTFPVVLGSGKRAFEGPASGMRLVSHEVTGAGVVIATYEPAGAVPLGDFTGDAPSAAECERRARMAAGVW